MIELIHKYLDEFEIPHTVYGYVLLSRIIEISLDNPGDDIQTLYSKLSGETGLATSKIKGRIRYALVMSKMSDEPAIKRFVCKAVNHLRSAKEGLHDK